MAAVLDVVRDLKLITVTVVGPASYALGGFLVDASASISWLGFMLPTVVVGTLVGHEFEIICNQDLAGAEAFGKGVVVIKRNQTQQASVSNTSVTGQPGGVTIQTTLSANTATTHTHPIDHNHGAITSSVETQAGAGSTAATTPDALNHVHSITIPAFVANTAAGGSHNHNRAFQYDHNHALTTTVTQGSIGEVAAGTNLSGVTFKILCAGFGAT